MNVPELDRALRIHRLPGAAVVLETRLRLAQSERLSPLDLITMLVTDELQRRKDHPLEPSKRRYERVSTLLTSNRPVDDWGKLLGGTPAVTALPDRLLHHAHVITGGRPGAGA